MRDNEIIKALECCADESYENCNECPYSIDTVSCERMKLLEDSLYLINRQNAEIERLQKEVNLVSIQFQDLKERYQEAQTEIERLEKEAEDKERAYNDEFCLRKEWQTKCQELLKEEQIIKSEARKEFVKKIKEKKMQSTMDIRICTIEMIDNLLKEMESENNG